jgi:hypothetical protein
MRDEQDQAKQAEAAAAKEAEQARALRVSEEYHLTTRPMTPEEEALGPEEALRRRVKALG